MRARSVIVAAIVATGCTSGLDELSHGTASSAASSSTASAGGATASSSTGGLGGGGASSTSAAGGAGGAGGGTGGSGGPPAPELDCTNGVDDDGDQKVDCADTDCAGFQCVEGAPIGWTGPALLWKGLPADPQPACPDGQVPIATGGAGILTAPSAVCEACGCGAAQGTTCAKDPSMLFDGAACSGQVAAVLDPMTPVGMCAQNGGNNLKSVMIGAAFVSGGKCPITGGGVVVPLASFPESAVVCALPSGGGCGAAGAVCAETPAPPFQKASCIVAVGDMPCPPGPYMNRTVVWTNVDDTRGCSACSCDPAVGVCHIDTQIFGAANCGNLLASGSSGCKGLGILAVNVASYKYVQTAPPDAMCQASGGAPKGGAAATDPVTVCCAN